MRLALSLYPLWLLLVGMAVAYDYQSYQSPFSGDDYHQAMTMTVRFFGGQRCGATHNWMLHENENTGNTCHTADAYNGHAVCGGWHDCGDHIKVATTMGYAAVCLLTAYDVWPEAFDDTYDETYGPANGIADVLDEVKVATDFFMASFVDDNTFVYYVGNGDYDHARWVTSSYQSELSVELGGDPRPVTATSSAGGPQAASYAAALAMMARLYPDASYASACSTAAINAYVFACQHPTNISIPTFYPSPNQETSDEFSLAAMTLYQLTGETHYRDEALDKLQGKWESNSPLAWDTFSDIAYYYILRHDPEADNGSGGTIADFLYKNVHELGIASGSAHPEGYPYFPNRWGTNKLASGSGFAAALFCDLIEREIIDRSPLEASAYIRRIIDYMLGENEFDHPFIHGFKNDMHFKVHHRNAMGVNSNPADEEKNSVPFLFASGALIGGPQEYNQFNNSINDYVNTESGCDYNAPFVAALAYVVKHQAPLSTYSNHFPLHPQQTSSSISVVLTPRQAGWPECSTAQGFLLNGRSLPNFSATYNTRGSTPARQLLLLQTVNLQ